MPSYTDTEQVSHRKEGIMSIVPVVVATSLVVFAAFEAFAFGLLKDKSHTRSK